MISKKPDHDMGFVCIKYFSCYAGKLLFQRADNLMHYFVRRLPKGLRFHQEILYLRMGVYECGILLKNKGMEMEKFLTVSVWAIFWAALLEANIPSAMAGGNFGINVVFNFIGKFNETQERLNSFFYLGARNGKRNLNMGVLS